VKGGNQDPEIILLPKPTGAFTWNSLPDIAQNPIAPLYILDIKDEDARVHVAI